MSYALTYLKQQASKIQATQKIVDNSNQNNVRGITDFLIAQSIENAKDGLITSDLLQKVALSWAQDAQMIKQVTPEPTLVNARTFTPTYSPSTSSFVNVTTGYVGFSIEVYPSEFINFGGGQLNQIAKEERIKRDFEAGLTKVINYVEDLTVAKLQATKTKVLTEKLGYSFVADSVVATNAQRKNVVSSLGLFMKGNNYPSDQIHVVGDMGAMQIVQDIREFGGNNSQNEQLRLDGKQFFATNGMPKPIGKEAAMFACPMGSVGFVSRVQPIAANELSTTDGWEFGVMSAGEMAAYNFPWALEYRFKSVGADVSTETGNAKDTAAIKEIHHFGFDVAIITPHNAADGGAKTPVIEVFVNTAETDADVTAPLVSTVTSAALTSLVVDFDSAIALDAAGDVAIGKATEAQLIAALTLTGAPLSSVSAVVASSDNTQLTITLVDGTDLTATDSISSTTLYDGAGNQFVEDAGKIAQINAGATAWEAIP